MSFLVLDSTPLGLLTQRRAPDADACRAWLASRIAQGDRVIVPEIVDYELRRELIRARRAKSLRRLERLLSDPRVSYLPITTEAMKLAAELWARARQQGAPTADRHALE